jgi:hypothetical protein
LWGGVILLAIYNCIQKRNNNPKIFYRKTLIGGFNGFIIPPFGIFIKESERDNKLLLEHEMVHWKQYQREGLIGFPLNYAIEAIQKGYDKNKYEIEARFREDCYCQENYTECIRTGKATAYNPKFRM